MKKLTRRSFVKAAGATAAASLGAVALAGCSSDEKKNDAPASNDAAQQASSAEEPFMSEGKGEHLVCAVTGKLIKIAPAIIAQQKGCLLYTSSAFAPKNRSISRMERGAPASA